MYSASSYYSGLGNPVAAVATIVSVEKKLSDIFGGKALRERYGKHAQEVLDHYTAAISNRDMGALQWLYDRSGAGDAVGTKDGHAVAYLEKGKGWHPKEFGGGLMVSNLYAGGFRTLTWEYYQDAARQLAVTEGPKGKAVFGGRLNNIDTPVYKATNAAPVLTLTPASTQPQPKTQQASVFGMDLGNISPTVLLAPLGLIALSFLLRDR